MAETQTGNPSPQPTLGAQPTGSSQSKQGSKGFTGQVQNAVGGASDQVSDMLDRASDQGGRYYQQGRQAIGNLNGGTAGGLFAAGAVGFLLAWLIFGQSRSGDDIAQGMSRSSDRYR